MLSPSEKRILKKVAENHIITRSELKTFLQSNGGSASAIDSVTRNLLKNNLLSEVNPIGSTCYVITQKGNRFLDEMKI